MIIKICPELRKYTGLVDELEVDRPLLGTALEELFEQYPQFLSFLMHKNGEQANKTSMCINGEYIWKEEELYRAVGPEDVLEIGREIPEGAGTGAKILVGVVLMVAALALSPWTLGASLTLMGPAWGMVFGMGASLVMSGISTLLVGSPEIPINDTGTSTSNTYTFSGIKNSTAPGTPIGVVYGRHRVGGHILNVYDRTIGDKNFLYQQVGVCDGPILEIEKDSVEINKRNINDYPQKFVEAFYRLGTEQQEAPESPLLNIINANDVVVRLDTPILIDNTIDTLNATELTLPTVASKVHISFSSPDFYSNWHMEPDGAWDSAGTYAPDRVIDYFDVYCRLSGVGAVYEKIGTYPLSSIQSYQDFWGYGGRSAVDDMVIDLPSENLFDLKLVRKTANVIYDTQTGYAVGSVQDDTWSWVKIWAPVDPYPRLEVVKYTCVHGSSIGYDSAPAMVGFNTITNSTYDGRLIINDPEGTVTYDSPGIEVSTSGIVDSLEAVISAPALYASSGGMKNTEAACRIYFKKDDGVDDYSDTPNELGINKYITAGLGGMSKSEISKSFAIPIVQFYGKDNYKEAYSIKLVRTSPFDSGDLTVENRIYCKYITETLNDTLIYPFTTLIGYRLEANENIQGALPNTTTIIKGRIIGVPEGYDGLNRVMDYDSWSGYLTANDPSKPENEQEFYTTNPAWCLLDLLTNPRYGLREKFRISDTKWTFVKANLFVMARYCDERILENGAVVPNPYEPGYNVDLWNLAKPRFSLNLVVDEAKSATDWVNTICSTMRASWFYNEGCFLIDIDRPKPISRIFNMTNIKDFSEIGNSVRSVPNSYEVQFFDAADGSYEQKLITVEAESLQTDNTVEERKKTLNVRGVTDEDQVRRLAKFALAAGERLTNLVTFKTGTNALPCMVGEVVGVQHDVPQWGFGGKITNVTDTGSYLLLELSDEINVSGEMSMMISHQNKTPETVNVLGESNGPTNTCSVEYPESWPGNGPAVGDTYIVGEVSNAVTPYKVLMLKRDADELVEVTGVMYDNELYSYADDLTNASKIVLPSPYSALKLPSRISVENFKAESRIYQDTTGNYKIGVDVFYSIPSDLFWSGAVIKYGLNGLYSAVPVDKTGYVFLPEVLTDGNYMFVACSQYADGTSQSVDEVLNDRTAVPYQTLEISQFVPNTEFQTGVKNLQVKGGGTSFTTKDCSIEWSVPVVIDALSGTTPTIGDGANNTWLKEYKVEVLNTNDGVRRTELVVSPAYTYTHDMNHQDGISRSFKFRVTAYDRLGRASTPVTISVSNPAPAAL